MKGKLKEELRLAVRVAYQSLFCDEYGQMLLAAALFVVAMACGIVEVRHLHM